MLEGFARHDPSIGLDGEHSAALGGDGHPPSRRVHPEEKELLSQTGDTFELTLLLTQTEALSYARHLAKVAGENESQPARARALADIG